MASLAELYGQAATSYGKARAKARQIPANLRESGKGLASWAVDPYGEAQRVMGEYRNMTPEQRQGLVNAAVDLFGGVDVGPVGGIMGTVGRTTVKKPLRKAFPGIYDDPRAIVEDSARMVAPENPLMNELFGVTRSDLDALTRAKQGSSSVDVPVYEPTARAAQHVSQIMTPANTRRVQSILDIASQNPRFAGSYGWYESQPLLQKYVDMFGQDEGTRRFKQHHGLGAALSPSTDVNTEIRRMSIANQLMESGRLGEFIDKSAIPGGAGHAYHKTAHVAGIQNLINRGVPFPEALQQAPKVRNYYYSRTGENTINPTIDAHMVRQIGLADVRPKPNYGSIGAEENFGVKNWFNKDVTNPLGMEGSPGQSLLWNAAGSKSGVETALGAPYLELLTTSIQRQAARSGKSPQTVLDEFLAGTGHLW